MQQHRFNPWKEKEKEEEKEEEKPSSHHRAPIERVRPEYRPYKRAVVSQTRNAQHCKKWYLRNRDKTLAKKAKERRAAGIRQQYIFREAGLAGNNDPDDLF